MSKPIAWNDPIVRVIMEKLGIDIDRVKSIKINIVTGSAVTVDVEYFPTDQNMEEFGKLTDNFFLVNKY